MADEHAECQCGPPPSPADSAQQAHAAAGNGAGHNGEAVATAASPAAVAPATGVKSTATNTADEKKSATSDKAPPAPDADVPHGRDWLTIVPSWLVSLIVHMSVLFLLALIVEPVKITKSIVDLVATDAIKGDNLEDVVSDLPEGALDADQASGLPDAISMSPDANGTDISAINDLPAAPGGPGEMASIGLEGAQVLDLGKALGGGGGLGGMAGIQGLEGRGDAAQGAGDGTGRFRGERKRRGPGAGVARASSESRRQLVVCPPQGALPGALRQRRAARARRHRAPRAWPCCRFWAPARRTCRAITRRTYKPGCIISSAG